LFGATLYPTFDDAVQTTLATPSPGSNFEMGAGIERGHSRFWMACAARINDEAL
jgi:hypothetical protein